MARYFEPRSSLIGDLTQNLQEFVVSNGVIATQGFALTLTSGYAELCGTNEPLLGIAAETVTGNTSSAKVKVFTDPNILYYNDADGNLGQVDDIGKVYQLTGSRRIDQSAAAAAEGASLTTYQFILVKTNPDGDNDLSEGLFKPHSPQLNSQ